MKWNTLFDQLEDWESHLKAENIDVDAILEPPSRKPVHRRKDVHTINQTIRQMKKAAGELSHEVLLRTSHGPRAFAVTDRIVFTKNDRTTGVKNGMLGTVEAIDEGQLVIRLDDEDGLTRSVCVNPSI